MGETDVVTFPNMSGLNLRTLPSDYKIFEIGHCIGVSRDDLAVDPDTGEPTPGSVEYFKIVNRKMMPRDVRTVASADLPSAGGSVNLKEKTNWKDWLEPSQGVLLNLLIGFTSNKYAEWEVKYPNANTFGATKASPDMRWTETDSSFDNPRLNIVSMYKQVPIFTLYNRLASGSLSTAAISAIGYKYTLAKLRRPQKAVDYIVMNDVIDSSKF